MILFLFLHLYKKIVTASNNPILQPNVFDPLPELLDQDAVVSVSVILCFENVFVFYIVSVFWILHT